VGNGMSKDYFFVMVLAVGWMSDNLWPEFIKN